MTFHLSIKTCHCYHGCMSETSTNKVREPLEGDEKKNSAVSTRNYTKKDHTVRNKDMADDCKTVEDSVESLGGKS